MLDSYNRLTESKTFSGVIDPKSGRIAMAGQY